MDYIYIHKHYNAVRWILKAKRQITQPNTNAHIRTFLSVLRVPMHILATWCHAHQCWVKLFTILTKPMYNKKKKRKKNKVTSGYIPFTISPGAPHTLPARFLGPCSRLPGCAGCTSSPTRSMWWCAGDGPAPQTGRGPLHVQSWTHALPKQMFGRHHSSVHGGVHWRAAWGSSQSGRCTRLSTPHKGWSTQLLCVLRLGLGPLGIPASTGELILCGNLWSRMLTLMQQVWREGRVRSGRLAGWSSCSGSKERGSRTLQQLVMHKPVGCGKKDNDRDNEGEAWSDCW